MTDVVLCIGGNMGQRYPLIQKAEELLCEKLLLYRKSNIYETAAWGDKSEGDYLNRVLWMKTDLSPFMVLDWALEVENKLGRKREVKWGNRTMDIDIIYFGNRIIRTDQLRVPHPFMQERKFVLEPLVEIMPDFIHPQIGLTNLEILRQSKDESLVRLWHPE